MNILQEMRRRRVFRFSAMYIVAAWLVVQVADIVFPAWDIPDAGIRYLIYAAFLAFPVAVVFSWFFDIGSGGITRTASVSSGAAPEIQLGISDYVLLAALLVIGVSVIIGSIYQIKDLPVEDATTVAIDERPANSVAVLPFDDLSGDGEDTFFSDGITDAILQLLASSGDLRVMGRTSSFAFRGSDFPVKRISEMLGVRYLVNGSVRRNQDQIEISAAVLDHAGFQLWRDSLEGPADQVFALQERMSRHVAEQILGEVIESGVFSTSSTTESVEAYRQYLFGMEFINKRPARWEEQAREAFKAAIEADPLYAPPYAGVALSWLVGAQPRARDERHAEAQRNIDIALRLDPNSALAYAARGFMKTYAATPDYPGAETDLQRALALDPSFTMAYNWLSKPLREQGRRDEADDIIIEGARVDPLNPMLAMNLVVVGQERGKEIEWVEQEYEKILAWPEPPAAIYSALHSVYQYQGRLDDAVEMAKRSIREFDYRNRYWQLYFLYARLGMFDDAHFWLDRMDDQFSDAPRWLNFAKSHRLFVCIAEGDVERAGRIFDEWLDPASTAFAPEDREEVLIMGMDAVSVGRYARAAEILEPALQDTPQLDDLFYFYYLHHAYSRLGQGAKAQALWQRIVTFETRKALDDVGRHDQNDLEALGLHLLAQGRADEAMTVLDRLYAIGFRDYYYVKSDPVLRQYLAGPEVNAWIARLKSDIDKMRQRVEAANREHDFKAEALAALGKED